MIFSLFFIPSPVPLRRIVLPGRRVSVTHTVCLLMTSSLCLVLASVISSASHTLRTPIRCTAFLPTVHPLQSPMPHLCLLGMQAKVTQKPQIQSNVNINIINTIRIHKSYLFNVVRCINPVLCICSFSSVCNPKTCTVN